ncbi:hypothetical protein ACRW2X_24385, partial [Escherichia coli]
VTLKMPAFEWVHVQLHQQKGMISLSPPTICNSAVELFDQKLLDRRRGEFRLFHISLPPDERLLRHSPSAVPIGSAVQMRDFR